MPPYAADTTAMILDTSSHSHQHDVKMANRDSSSASTANNIMAQPQHLVESSSKKSRRRKTTNKQSVSFNDYDEVVEIKHISDFSKRRIAATYWSSEEREVFRLDAMKLIHDEEIEPTHLSLSLKTGEQAHASEQTAGGVEDDFRGLDQHTTTYSDKCRRNVDELYDIVYECQTFEDTEGARVPDQVLADLLWEVSQHTTRAARVRAIADEVRALQS
eukprot:CAMPEP_0113460886 /NCGR_PEP_ID=MMETSP0014_2-20120614/11237_1 /TAXON_ID=2857 /ORGANISM="Nitzschia sp." /LENGTH=216 /DNA_ID=CAMNT_0000352591 /DNA_START=90 /DNA_END=740 /DNA_ORIENTATION=+ /assembly_acc=CAM_ASM_000159